MPLAPAGDIRLHYDASGSGPPLILAHAYLGRADVWAGQRMALISGYRVIAYDARGHGRSDAPDDPAAYSLDIAVSDLIGLMDALGIDRTHVCGLSMGAETVLHALLKQPERFMSATLADVGSGSDDMAEFIEKGEILAKAFLEHGSLWAFERLLERGSFAAGLGERRQQTVASMKRIVENHPAHAMAHTMRGYLMRRPTVYSLEPLLRKVTSPVLVIRGELDERVAEPSAFLARTMPTAREIVIPGVGHVTNILAPTRFNEALRTFLSAIEDDTDT